MSKGNEVKEGIFALSMIISGFFSLLFMFLQDGVYSIYATIVGLISLVGYVGYVYHLKKDDILRSGWY